ncbi:MAG: PepSY-associated TM helix domain-containing protein [Pseudomonadota bacterium]|nr:PepSY-associated TM helix domain-containing protein [Pseudomonadota bacterium]
MKSISIKKLFQLHSWVGVVTGILLFIVAFTGAFAVFSKPYLSIWASASENHVSSTVSAKKIEHLINHYAKKVPSDFRENIHVYMPKGYGYTRLVLLYESHDGDENYDHETAYVFELNSQNYALENEFYGPAGEYYQNRQSDMGNFIAHFHADLHLGRPIGLILTGFLGLTLMVSVITGLFIHREMIKQLFTFRRKKSTDIVASDGHKLFGVWGCVFHFVIGFTGAFLGLATVILLPAAAYVSFNGDQDKLIETFTAMPEPIISEQYQPTEIAKIISQTHVLDSKAELLDLTIMALNDENSVVYARMLGGENFAPRILEFAGDGSLNKSMSSFGNIPGPAIKVVEWIFPLHFGNFGGIFVKTVWAVLGLTTALIPLSGVMMWIAKRSRGQNPEISKIGYQRWNRFIIGTCGGIVLACFILFPVQITLNMFFTRDLHNNLISLVFFGCWLAWMAMCILPIDYKRLLNLNIILVALSLLLVVPLKLLFQSSYLSQLTNSNYLIVTSVDLVCLLLAIATLFAYRKLNSTKEDKVNNPATLAEQKV